MSTPVIIAIVVVSLLALGFVGLLILGIVIWVLKALGDRDIEQPVINAVSPAAEPLKSRPCKNRYGGNECVDAELIAERRRLVAIDIPDSGCCEGGGNHAQHLSHFSQLLEKKKAADTQKEFSSLLDSLVSE